MMQSRIIEELVQAGILTGRLDDLARRLGGTPDELRDALWWLARVRAIDVHTLPAGHLAVRRERRSRPAIHGERDRRRYRRESWML